MLTRMSVVSAIVMVLLFLEGRLSAQEKEVEAVRPLLARFTYKAEAGPITVYSDISAKFSEEHAKHAEKVWVYFSKVFTKTPGDKTILYYTRDKKLYQTIASQTQFQPLANARLVTCLWDKDHRIWFIVPYQEPDFGTQVHELSHDFLYATYRGSADFPWIVEGTGMYWESGHWDKKGDLIVEKPVVTYLRGFKVHNQKGELIPLRELVTLPRDKFWTSSYPASKTYGQSMVLIHYLMNEHPAVMKELFDRLNKGEIKDNDKLLEVLLGGLKMDLAGLEKKYIAYGLKIKE